MKLETLSFPVKSVDFSQTTQRVRNYKAAMGGADTR
jgi:hypothetical protein